MSNVPLKLTSLSNSCLSCCNWLICLVTSQTYMYTLHLRSFNKNLFNLNWWKIDAFWNPKLLSQSSPSYFKTPIRIQMWTSKWYQLVGFTKLFFLPLQSSIYITWRMCVNLCEKSLGLWRNLCGLMMNTCGPY